jgi:hypothetical protein
MSYDVWRSLTIPLTILIVVFANYLIEKYDKDGKVEKFINKWIFFK